MSLTGDFRPDGLVSSARVGAVSNKKILALREQFLAEPESTDLSMLRPVIARSWQRSRSLNVLSASTSLRRRRTRGWTSSSCSLPSR